MTLFNRLEAKERTLRGKSLIAYKESLKLTDIQKEVLIGTLLGDSTIPKQQNKAGYNVKFEQTSRQQDYIWHLYELFLPFVGTPPKVRAITGGKAKDRESIWFRTYRHIAFKFYYDFFYPVDTQDLSQRKKKVPKTIHKVFTPRALAYWYMDDGTWSKESNHYILNTQGFIYSDICILQKALKYCFNLDTSIHKDKTFFKLYIQSQCKLLFRDLIKPYVLESFSYKLPLDTEKFQIKKLKKTS
jgi:LAGLIDADG DNA endonuclease family